MKNLGVLLTIFFLLVGAYLLFVFAQSGVLSWLTPAPRQVIESHNIVLEKIEQLGKLELVKYKFRDIYEHRETGWVADEKVVLIVSGEAVGCIDLKKVRREDISNSRDTLRIKLPKPELCYYKINQNESRIYDSFYLRLNSADLFGKAFKEAERAIKKTAEQSNILEQTQQSGERLLKPLFEQIAQKKVVLVFQ